MTTAAVSIGRRDALQWRLRGSVNHIMWRARDLDKIFAKFDGGGVDLRDISGAIASSYRADPALVLRDGAVPTSPYTFIISTRTVDRMNDVIEAWNLDAYRANPIVLWQHTSSLFPIGRSTRVWIEGTRLKATLELTDASPEAERARRLIEGGFLRAASVGFIPLRWEFSRDPARPLGIDVKEAELVEWSVVSAPANRECLLVNSDSANKSLTPVQERRRREVDAILMRYQ